MIENPDPDSPESGAGRLNPDSSSAPYGGARPKVNVKLKEKTNGSRKSPKTGESFVKDYSSKHGSPVYKRTRGLDRTSSSDNVMFINQDDNLDNFPKLYNRRERNSVEDWDQRSDSRDWIGRSTTESSGWEQSPLESRDIPILSTQPIHSNTSSLPSISNSSVSMSAKFDDFEFESLDNLEPIEDDCYIYTYKGGTAYLSADLPTSFFRLDSGSDGESLPGVSGAGQSNLSTGVAALLQDQLLNLPVRPDSPEEQDFLELDFDPGSDDSERSSDSGQGPEEELVSKNALVRAPLLPNLAPLPSHPSLAPLPSHPSLAPLPSRSPSRLLPEPTFSSISETISPKRTSSRRTSQSSLRECTGRGSESPDPSPSQPFLLNTSKEMKTRSLPPREVNFQNNNNLSDSWKQSLETVPPPCLSCDKEKDVAPLQESSSSFLQHPVTAVRSVPLTSPVDDVTLLNVPRSKSLNSNMSACLAAYSSTEEDKIMLCGNRLLQREAFFFGSENKGILEALNSLTIREKLDRSQTFPRALVWSEKDAIKNHVSQLGTSACGATALMNVLIAMNINVEPVEVCKAVNTRLRRLKSDLPDYLLSRSEAGCNHIDLLAGMRHICGDRVQGRFFPMHGRKTSLGTWLATWISRGCIPVATLNVQRAPIAPGMQIADAWHHQMIWGVTGRDILLNNPLEVVPESILIPQLNSPSQILIRREDVLSRFNSDTDLTPLISSLPGSGFSERWIEFNVLGQVVNLLREEKLLNHPESESITPTSHLRIPANYISGITLFCDNPEPEVLALFQSTEDFSVSDR